jgi:hypothetical protein
MNTIDSVASCAIASPSENVAQASLSRLRPYRLQQRASRALAAFSVFGLTALLPGLVLSEGAVRLLECTVTQVCDGGGACETASGGVSFRMEPVEREASGAMRYALSYGDTQADMLAVSDAGPFIWTVRDERNALLASSQTQWLWHRLTLDPAPAATIRFLTCSFRQ